MTTTILMRGSRTVLLLAATSLLACTASQEQRAEVGRPAVPAQILTDADRQAAYNSNAGYGGAVPDATPGRVPIRSEASSTNAQQRPENINTDAPNNKTPETRLNRLRGAPVDTMRLPPG